jgi:hypothetical protein
MKKASVSLDNFGLTVISVIAFIALLIVIIYMLTRSFY